MEGGNKTILIVDDDKEDRFLLQDTFDELGYGELIHFEENGEKAIRYLDECLQSKCLPRLVILDLNMPKLNGRQTLQYIKKHPSLKDIAVVIFSTSLNPIERDECLALGAYSYEVKPITYNESVVIAKRFYSLSNEMKN